MSDRHFRYLLLAVAWIATMSGSRAETAADAELSAAIQRIDRRLLEQSERDIRAWLDARIAATGDFGVYPFGHQSQVRVQGDTMVVDLNRGGTADAAAQFLRAYEMLGDRRYLEAGLKTADFYLQVQQPAGHLPSGATIQRGGRATAGGGKHPVESARLEDGYQYRPFALLLYAHRVSGDARYRDAALRLGDLITQRVQHPAWGWQPSHFDTTDPDPYSSGEYSTSNYGVVGGGSLADYCTTDGFRIAVTMYHVTGDRKHLARIAHIGDWIHATQMGRGPVRGWADNYNARNEPVPARHYEGLAIDPRNFNRYVGPMLTWLYAMTGEERHRVLFQETYRWLRDQEHPDGWPSEYTYDGHPAWTENYITYRYDQPETWPAQPRFDHAAVDGRPWYTRSKVQLGDAALVDRVIDSGGLVRLREECFTPAPASTATWYRAARLEAAGRCADENLRLDSHLFGKGGTEKRPRGTLGYLERVRRRPAAIKGSDPKALVQQAWTPYAGSLPPGGEAWQFVWDARLALGLIDPEIAAPGGRGLAIRQFPRWHVMGDWAAHAVKVRDWVDVPLSR